MATMRRLWASFFCSLAPSPPPVSLPLSRSLARSFPLSLSLYVPLYLILFLSFSSPPPPPFPAPPPPPFYAPPPRLSLPSTSLCGPGSLRRTMKRYGHEEPLLHPTNTHNFLPSPFFHFPPPPHLGQGFSLRAWIAAQLYGTAVCLLQMLFQFRDVQAPSESLNTSESLCPSRLLFQFRDVQAPSESPCPSHLLHPSHSSESSALPVPQRPGAKQAHPSRSIRVALSESLHPSHLLHSSHSIRVALSCLLRMPATSRPAL